MHLVIVCSSCVPLIPDEWDLDYQVEENLKHEAGDTVKEGGRSVALTQGVSNFSYAPALEILNTAWGWWGNRSRETNGFFIFFYVALQNDGTICAVIFKEQMR